VASNRLPQAASFPKSFYQLLPPNWQVFFDAECQLIVDQTHCPDCPAALTKPASSRFSRGHWCAMVPVIEMDKAKYQVTANKQGGQK